MQKWEYKRIRYKLLDVGAIVKGKTKDAGALDPDISDWMALTFRYQGSQDVCRVVWSDSRQVWTMIDSVLAELGDDGWELVGTTPHLSVPAGAAQFWDYPNFDYLFKRPKAA